MDYLDESLFDEELVLLGEDGAPFFEDNRPVAFYSSGPVWPNNHIHVLRPLNPNWSRYIVYNLNVTKYIDFVEGSTRHKLTQSRMMDIPIVWPSHGERKRILDFLDHETARIDVLIEEQQRLIDLLQEKRQAVISHAVTKGLDPDGPMKDSGVDWIGEIPHHWTIKRLWHLTPPDRQIMYGIILPGPHFEGGIPIVKGGDVAEHKLKLADLSRTTPEIEASYARSRLKQGDLVYSIRGSIGEVAEIPAELEGANLTQDAARIAPSDSVNGKWLLYSLQAPETYAQLEAKAVGATIRGINIRDLNRALLPVPPVEEQIAIATFLENRLKQFAHLEQEAANGISLMQEHRSALISAAVTGKIDVRGWNPQDTPVEHALLQAAEAEAQYG